MQSFDASVQAGRDEGIYAVDYNGVRCWINQDASTSSEKAYGDIRGQYSLAEGGQYDTFQQALDLYRQGKRDEATDLLRPKFALVTSNYE